jgi:hypothetical protein
MLWYKMARLTFKDLRRVAQSHGGDCIGGSYVNTRSQMRWQCAKKHEWEAAVKNVRYEGNWCPYCAGKAKLTIEQMRLIAHARGGECLSTEYQNNDQYLYWRCKEGHEWKAKPSHIKNQETWCPDCANNKRCTIDEMRQIALDRGGKCLSAEYQNASTKLRWKCAKKHVWEASADSIKHMSSWCPNCRFKNEQLCREIVEEMTGQPFAKQKPKWLEGLELDGYNDALGLAFEYHGEQHDREMPHWHHDAASLEAQKAHDVKKQYLCDDNWVTVIVIWYNCHDKRSFIRDELKLLGYVKA